jgi:hypothetical protein
MSDGGSGSVIGVVSGGAEIGMRCEDRGAAGIVGGLEPSGFHPGDGREAGGREESVARMSGDDEGDDGMRGVDAGDDAGGMRGDEAGAEGEDDETVGASPRLPKLGDDSGRLGAFGITAVVSRGESDRGGGEGRPDDAQPA